MEKSWVKKWNVEGSNGDVYVVSQKDDGTFGCSCPAWKFAKAPKPDCKHIRAHGKATDDLTRYVLTQEKKWQDQQKRQREAIDSWLKQLDKDFTCPRCNALSPVNLAVWERWKWLAKHVIEHLNEQPTPTPEVTEVQVNGDFFKVKRIFNLPTE